MKEVDKKEAPDVAGGYVGPLVEDPPVSGEPFPKFPTTPIDLSDDSPKAWR